jgi:hypothetical protein
LANCNYAAANACQGLTDGFKLGNLTLLAKRFALLMGGGLIDWVAVRAMVGCRGHMESEITNVNPFFFKRSFRQLVKSFL